jgi:hypothetical protein
MSEDRDDRSTFDAVQILLSIRERGNQPEGVKFPV